MKKKDQKQNRKPRRLSLNRETVRVLNDPALLALAEGGMNNPFPCGSDGSCCPTGSDTHQDLYT